MSRTFDDSLAADIENTFLNVNEFAVTVSIGRGVHTTTGVAAIVAMKEDEVVGPNRMGTGIRKRNYRIRASQYKVNGVVVEPRQGDVITETLKSGGTLVGQVLPEPGQQCFEYDSSGTLLLVRTKQSQ